MRVRGVRRPAARAHGDAQRSLRAARELALGRLAVDEEPARRRKTIRRARAVGSLLFADDEQQVDALLAALRQPIGGTSIAAAMPFASHAPRPCSRSPCRRGGDVRRDGVEVRRERDAAPAARCPDVRASARHFLESDVPAARDEPARDEIDRAALGAGRRVDSQQLRGERDDVGHDAKLARPKYGRYARGSALVDCNRDGESRRDQSAPLGRPIPIGVGI